MDVKIGQVVLIGDDHVPIAKWPMGVVIQVQHGDHALVRVVVVRTATGIYKRNVSTLAPLPIDGEAEQGSAPEEQLPEAEVQMPELPEGIELEESPPPLAPQAIWDGRLRPKWGRKWKYKNAEWVTSLEAESLYW